MKTFPVCINSSPQNIFQNVQVDFAQITAITAMFAARNVALGTIAAFALWQRDPKYLLMVFIARFIVELLDLIITVAAALVSAPALLIVVVWIMVFLLPQFIGIRVLFRLTNQQ